jgi:ectoine hydroxylase-related dioxygenase (phytanoyl-CoA dioxygenase family)
MTTETSARVCRDRAEAVAHLCEHGFAVHPRLELGGSELEELRAEADRLLASGRAGERNAANASEAIGRLAASAGVRGIVESVLSPAAFVARSIVFDKNPRANWDVTWHQDATIAVVQRREAPGFGPWSVKSGVPHVRPPAEVLGRMVTLRIHLDDCMRENGALLVVPGSHRSFIAESSIAEWASVVCECRAGEVLLMRPLILHASKKAAVPSHRRIVHLEFAADPLPGGLEWARL